jgi:hypothetical protein
MLNPGGFKESIKHTRFFTINITQENLMETTEILCVEIYTRKNAHKSTIYIGTKSGKIEVYVFHVRNMKLARIYVFDCFKPIYGIYIVYEKARVI